MTIAVPRVSHPGERRVAAMPDTVAQLGYTVGIESGAGVLAAFSDDAYQGAGARIVADPHTL